MNAIKISLNMFLVLMFLISVPALAQGKYDSTEAKHKTMKHDHKMKHGMKDSAHQLTIKNKKKSILIRERENDLEAIDENSDGKVFQCPLDCTFRKD